MCWKPLQIYGTFTSGEPCTVFITISQKEYWRADKDTEKDNQTDQKTRIKTTMVGQIKTVHSIPDVDVP